MTPDEKKAAREKERRAKKRAAKQRARARRLARLWQTTDGRCIYCNVTVPKKERTLEHLWPKSKGGSKALDNILPACGPCNRTRGVQWPASHWAHPRWVGVVRDKERAQGWQHADDAALVAECKALAGRVPMEMMSHLSMATEHSSGYVNKELGIGMESHTPGEPKAARYGYFVPSKTEPVRRWWYRVTPVDAPMYGTLWELLMFDEELRAAAAARYPAGGEEGA
jgi:5-methylcytosine-specific restriction endonuclease McrA